MTCKVQHLCWCCLAPDPGISAEFQSQKLYYTSERQAVPEELHPCSEDRSAGIWQLRWLLVSALGFFWNPAPQSKFCFHSHTTPMLTQEDEKSLSPRNPTNVWKYEKLNVFLYQRSKNYIGKKRHNSFHSYCCEKEGKRMPTQCIFLLDFQFPSQPSFWSLTASEFLVWVPSTFLWSLVTTKFLNQLFHHPPHGTF